MASTSPRVVGSVFEELGSSTGFMLALQGQAAMIERKRSCTDRRRHVVTVTRAGKRRLARAAQAQREAEDALFAGLTEQQRDQLRDLLVTLRDTNRTEPADDDCE